MQDRWTQLRQEVYDLDAESSWERLKLLLECWQPREELTMARDYLSSHLHERASDILVAQDLQADAPWWPLVRGLWLPEANSRVVRQLAALAPRDLVTLGFDILSANAAACETLRDSGLLGRLEKFLLSNHQDPGLMGWAVLCEAPMPKLQKLTLESYQASDSILRLLLGGRTLPALRHLDLNQAPILGKNLVHLGKTDTMPALESLRLPLQAYTASQCQRFLASPMGRSLKDLSISLNEAHTWDEALHLVNRPSLRSLALPLNRHREPMIALGKLLQAPSCAALQHLELRLDPLEETQSTEVLLQAPMAHTLRDLTLFNGTLQTLPMETHSRGQAWSKLRALHLYRVRLQGQARGFIHWNLPALRHLSLSHMLGLSDLVGHPCPWPLESLYLMRSPLDDIGLQRMLDHKWWEALTTLHVEELTGPHWVSRLAAHPKPTSLRHLALRSSHLTDEGLLQLAQAGWLQNLESLDLRYNPLTGAGISRALAMAPPLRLTLDLPSESRARDALALVKSPHLTRKLRQAHLHYLTPEAQNATARALGVTWDEACTLKAGFPGPLPLHQQEMGGLSRQAWAARNKLLAAYL